MADQVHTAPARLRLSGDAALWASAIVVFALILTQAGRLVGSAAHAEMVSTAGQYTVLTADGGTDDVLVLLDQRTEEVFVYRVGGNRRLELAERQNLSQLFADARRAAGGN